MSENIYIHYGSDKFERELFMPIVNREMFTKPYGGLWASDVESNDSWKQFCLESEWRINRLNKSFKFQIDESARIIQLTNIEDLKQLPRQTMPKNHIEILDKEEMWICPDFEQLVKDGVDAVQLNLSTGDYELYYKLYMWDCDSILIMNPDIIKPM